MFSLFCYQRIGASYFIIFFFLGLFRVYLPDSTEDAVESPVNGSQASNHEDLNPTDAILSDDDSEEDRQKSAVMQNCFTALVETLGSQDERTISEAKNLIHELHRITLLWDELWLGTLNLHQSEVNRWVYNVILWYYQVWSMVIM